jgi:hypothetical protein
MQIYEKEILDGIADIVKSNASIAYASEIHPTPVNEINSKQYNIDKSIANLEDSDLYYVQSILVTSSWNKNDDIFDKNEVWLSRNTPEDKPTNLEHDEGVIIGHIVSNWPIDEDGALIDDNIDPSQIPEKFHILTGSVIYKGFSNPELKARSEKLIAEIENGTKYVSMECYFKGFDYGLINQSNNEYKVLARNAETAFLTKHLRAYGGLGEHEGYKIGRVLRGITFSGKGYVDKPANPDSIIFNGQNLFVKKNTDFIKAGVFTESPNKTENNTMSVEKDIEELKARVEASSDCAQATKDAYSLAIELKDKITELEATIATQNSELNGLKAANEELVQQTEAAKKMSQEEMMKKEEDMKKAKSELDSALETIAAYKGKEAEMMKKEKKMKRMASLLDLGLDNEAATATVDKLESLEDDAFDSFAEVLKATMHSKKKEEKKETKAEEVVTTDVLETAEVVTEADLSVGGEEDVVQNTRAALIDFMYSRLNKKNLNKGE